MEHREASKTPWRRPLRVLTGGLLAFVAFSSSIGMAFAQSSDQTKKQIADVIDEIERQQEIIDQLAEDHVVALDELRQVQAEIVTTAARVQVLEGELGVVRDQVSHLALDMFVSGDQAGGIGALLTSDGNATETVERNAYASLALSAGLGATDQLDATLNDLANEKAQLARQEQAAADLIERVESKSAATEKKTEALHKFRKEKEALLGEQLAAEQRRREEELIRESQAAIAQAKADAKAAAARAAVPVAPAPRVAAVPGGQGGTPAPVTPRAAPVVNPAPTPGDGGGGDPTPESPESPAEPQQQPEPQPAPEPEPQPEPEPPRNRPPAPSPGAGGAVAAAMSQLGVPYRYATAKPEVSFDCSGLTAWAWGEGGVSLPHQSRAQFASIPHVDQGDIQPGDLIFFYSPISHVGLYIGDGQMVHAPRSGDVVKVSGVRWGSVTGIGRPG